jgi:hypothetical protein
MDNCSKSKELVVLHSEGALDASQSAEVMDHLGSCTNCRREAGEINQIRAWLADPEIFSPNQDLAWQILPRTLAARAKSLPSVKWWQPANFGKLGWTLSMVATIIFAFGSVWLVNRPRPDAEVASMAAAPGNAAFLSRMQNAYAREATALYLSECQDLLMALMRAGKSCPGQNYDVSFEVERAQRLLRSKQLLEAELKFPDAVRAKPLCDELENFLVSLSTSDRCESLEKMRRMESFIQREQLMLRISLLQSELS